MTRDELRSADRPSARLIGEQPVPLRLDRLVRRAADVDRGASLVGDRLLLLGQLEELVRGLRAAVLVGHPLLGRDARTEAARFGPLAGEARLARGREHDRRLRKLRKGSVLL